MSEQPQAEQASGSAPQAKEPARAVELSGYPPSDQPHALSPMQAGMLFQYLLSEGVSDRAGFDIEQLHIRLQEALDPHTLGKAFSFVARRHPILSVAFRWEGVEQPQQAPQQDVNVPVEVLDWREAEQAELPALRAEFLTKDRKRSFDLRRAPLMRATLCLRGPKEAELFWTFHHILLDGRSFADVLLEVFDAYDVLKRNGTPALPPTPRPYSDYVAWLRAQPTADSLAFFRSMLRGKGSPTPLPLAEPAARPLPRSGSHTVSKYLSETTARDLASFAERHETTVAGLLQVAWAIVLYRLTGDTDAVFGTVRSVRRSGLGGEAEHMFGLFINSLPMRLQLDEELSISELIQKARTQSVALRAHDQLGLVDIQRQSELPPGTALFETLLMYENRELNRSLREQDPRWNTRTCLLHEQPSLPLTVIVVNDERLELRVVTDRKRYREGVAERISGYLSTALSSLLRATHIKDVEVLPEPERQRILFEWNDTAREFSDHARIHELFEARVAEQPDAIAVEYEGQTLTYSELEAKSNRVANTLRARGAKPGQYVAVCLSRSLDLVVCLIGVAKSGAAYVPIDADYPRDRIAFMLEDSAAELVVTEPEFVDRFDKAVLLAAGPEFAGASSERPQPSAAVTDPCYAIYTSGSTGRPKGVVLTHRAVVNTLEWVSRTYEVHPGDRLLFVTSPCFDLSVYDMFGTLGAGATVVVASSECMREPRTFVDSIISQKITVWDSAPAALQRLSPFFPTHGGQDLRLVMLSGDWIPLTLPDDVRRSFPAARVMSMGGATEAAIWSNWFPIGALDPRWTSIPYGRPIQNSHYHVLDKRMKPVPIGVPGDLYIGGTCLASGYLNRPELTAERFIRDPFRPEGRLYMTGDLARYFDDGVMEFLGRADFQVKIRGYRVELGEVEAAIQALPGVREVLCAAYTDASGQKALVAYAVPQAAATLDEGSIVKALSAKLPSFMVPSQIILLPAMPVTANGKVDRKALPSPTERSLTTEYIAPRNELEEKLVGIWEDLLKRERIGVTDSFFALGGQSLLAVMLVSRIERDLGVRLPLSRVLEHPTIEALASSLGTPAAKRKGHLITVSNRGKATPLVLISGIGGFGFIFHGLGNYLGNDHPLHVLNAVGAEDEDEALEHTIEGVANVYEPQIVAACPEGPVVLGGYSFGVLVALELALRFERMGREVPLIVSFDGFAPGHPRLMPVSERLKVHARELWRRSHIGRTEYIAARFERVRQRFQPEVDDEALAPPDLLDPEMNARLKRVADALFQAREKYRPKTKANCDVLLLKASIPFDWSGSIFDPLYGWRDFVRGKIDTQIVPGEHLHMFRTENDQLLAELLRERLAELSEPKRI
ncbi:MAG TPA: amino acid adenylation domain-containing protein [Polyangiales bacterium]|nr:amino acid adenylation domain-containing protein [Polyangiales bacterium]